MKLPMTEPFDVSEPELSRRTPLGLWICAALGAVLIHAGCVALALAYAPDEDDEAFGAPAIEIGIELAAPRLEATDLPPGPDADASAASPSVIEQEKVAEQTDLPKATPTETDDPDRVVAPDSQKPQDEPKVATVQAAPSQLSIAAEATATPTIETAPEAPRSVAPVQGTGESARRVRVTWEKELAAHLDRHKRYPAERSRQAAEIVLSFELDRTGHVLATRIVQGSGDPAFDEAALAMMRRSDPVPPPPPLVADAGLSFTLPVIFRVKRTN
jgi:periplasmic protein TonB